ncbi:unnamed protein product [Phaeothamnion confervicola]
MGRSQSCRAQHCKKVATHALPKEKARFCSAHAAAAMEDKRKDGEGRGVVKPPTMEPEDEPGRCRSDLAGERCKRTGTHTDNIENCVVLWCFAHKKPGMIKVAGPGAVAVDSPSSPRKPAPKTTPAAKKPATKSSAAKKPATKTSATKKAAARKTEGAASVAASASPPRASASSPPSSAAAAPSSPSQASRPLPSPPVPPVSPEAPTAGTPADHQQGPNVDASEAEEGAEPRPAKRAKTDQLSPMGRLSLGGGRQAAAAVTATALAMVAAGIAVRQSLG